MVACLPEITIRRILSSDLDDASELAMLAIPHTTKEIYKRHVSDELKENQDLSFVAIEGEDVVRYVQADILNGEAVIEDIGVAKKFHGKDIRRHLFEKELKALKSKNVKIVLAEARYKLVSATPFYCKHNLRITKFMHVFFGMGNDAIILKLVLQ